MEQGFAVPMVDVNVAGLVGGFVGTIVMTPLMMKVMGEGPSPTQVLASKVLGGPPEDRQGLGMLLHLVYGTVGGLILVLLAEALLDPVATYSTTGFTLVGLGWGVVLWIVAIGWMMVLGMAEEMMDAPMGEKLTQMGGMLVVHLVYGAVAGAVTVALV